MLSFDLPQPVHGLSAIVDVDSRTVLSARIWTRLRHDLLDGKGLVRACAHKPSVLLADKGYGAEWLHR